MGWTTPTPKSLPTWPNQFFERTTHTMKEKEIRKLAAKRALELALVRADSDLTDNALGYLHTAAKKTIEWEDAVSGGTSFDVKGCVTAVRASEIGKMIFGEDESEDQVIDHVAATQSMTPRDKLEYARKHGLK